MKLATTTGDFENYCKGYKECVKNVCDAGFKYIDLSMYGIKENYELLLADNWRDNVKRLQEYTDTLGARFVQAHSPGGNPIKGDAGSELLLKTTIRSVEVCGELGIKNIVVHSGTLPGLGKKEFFEENKKFYEKLFPAMEKNNVNVLCENSTAANVGDMYFTNSGADMKSFVEYINHPLFHACWDTGHANIEGNQYNEIIALGDDLKAVHINDNRGAQDEHLIPYFGTVKMDEIMHALKDVDFKGYFTFEASSSLLMEKYWLRNRRNFTIDKRLINPQLFMQKHLEKLLFDTGVYMLETYNCYEE